MEDTTATLEPWIAARRTFACPQQAKQARQTSIRLPNGAGARFSFRYKSSSQSCTHGRVDS